jgi:hypothetical protein
MHKDSTEDTGTTATIYFTGADTKPNSINCDTRNTSYSSNSKSGNLFISQDQTRGIATLGKTEQTLIINTDGTQATLITPVVSAEAAESNNAVMAAAPTITFPQSVGATLNVESIGKHLN